MKEWRHDYWSRDRERLAPDRFRATSLSRSIGLDAIIVHMLIAAVRRRVAALRQPASLARIAQLLWVAWAIILWNVVFDHVIVVAGRDYLVAAVRSAHDAALSSPVNMDDWMRPAVTQGLWIATAAAAAVLITGLVSVRQAVRRSSSNSAPR
jgi:hypothetical protein